MILHNTLRVANPTPAQILAYFDHYWTLVETANEGDQLYYEHGNRGQDIYKHLLGDESYHTTIIERIAQDEQRSILEVYNTITGADFPSWEAALIFFRANTEKTS